jgi:hypothetical protein
MKQRLPPERRLPTSDKESRSERGGSVEDLSVVRGRMGGDADSSVVATSVVVDTALPIVSRATLALEVEPPQHGHNRLVEILRQSGLERREELIDKLRADEAITHGVNDVLVRVFGPEGAQPATREAVLAGLSRVERALASGAEEGGVFLSDLGAVVLSAAAMDGAVGARAEALVADLGTALSDVQAPDRRAGDALLAVCLGLQLALLWDEEEEEETFEDVEASP